MQKVWLHDAGRDAISGGLGFPFSSPMRRISSRARRHTMSRFSQLVHGFLRFYDRTIQAARGPLEFPNDIARNSAFTLLGDCAKQFYFIY